ncbi:CheR family methyltransferase [Chitinophaga ginsengisoli]|uniref:Two-component system CheB/CheR fusion protein n=1 Tax=Chitinophaga ginsengisoli TaxID=363837 RepID=A0A2P8G2L0_9BACT|nr:CheR family methyltransferase [Chitinophaga ginsengisoli]PSL28105.1 two-component system CheB/CheR fusion protein [Chitinophaga ginsengisoli]
MDTTEPRYVIAIGASAGGMEDINSFFDYTQLDSVSYVIVQHLSADFKSRMVELLAKHSKLVVKEAENEMIIKANEVYLIPNDKFMTVSGRKLCLTPKELSHAPYLTINRFLSSLAVDYGEKSIGVILSGLGTDGTEGAIAIKKAGGMVIARNPETSDYGSMPSSAIATGMVDFILEPPLIPGMIEQYVMNGLNTIAEYKEDKKSVAIILDIIREQSPLDFSDYKESTILRRIKRRSASKNFNTLDKYINFLRETPDEIEALTKEFLISVTSFFRDEAAFNFIQHSILPDILLKINPGDELKLWVAGCATGEEAYSLAILIHEQLIDDLKDLAVKIFATDIDTEALLYARIGLYKDDIEKDITPERIKRYFSKEQTGYRVKPDIRRMVVFAQHDLVKNPPYCNMDIISCRNVLIYMAPTLQKKIFSMLLFGLKIDGHLFLGISENPMPIIQNLDVVNKKYKIYKNIGTKQTVRFDAFSLPQLLDVGHKTSHTLYEAPTVNVSTSIGENVSDNLAKELGCLTICIDENNRVVKSYGDTSKYLLQKNFTLHLPELLPRPLAVAFNTASREVIVTGKKHTISGIRIAPSSSITVSISVYPLNFKKGAPRLLMVTIIEDKVLALSPEQHVAFDERKHLDQYIFNLEEEMREMKDKLNAAYEKLDASNENMQSFNEELVSANEELQSTNEEMQSVNEELHTINSDYQLKNKELGEINDDLNNYFRSNINGQLFISKNLLLMKFSPVTATLINLRDTDIGRPIGNISTNFKFNTIIVDIEKVLEDGVTIKKEIETNDGKWYQVTTMPYIRQTEYGNSGAVITFSDITELKAAQEELQQKNNSLLQINSNLDYFINTISRDLLEPLGGIANDFSSIDNLDSQNPELKAVLNVINTSIEKVRLLIGDIATIRRTESGM